jgi:phage tail-like protein
MSSAARKDPLPVFCFLVQLPGIGGEAFFKSVSGLKYETEVVPVREGGQNLTNFNLIGGVKWSNIVLKQGFTKDSGLLKWQKDWCKPTPGSRIDGTITQLDTALVAQCTWTFVRGWPVKWEMAELDASKNELAIETLEIAHEGLIFK